MTPARPGLVLSLKRLDRLLEHEPGDLTATAEAGLTFGAFQEALGRRGQWLSLDPPNARQGTLGGILASNASGPRRHLYGTMRDLLIGLTMVLADGSIVRGGGKVVKNVAGYDLPKLAIGSFGTLGVLVEATFKLRPRPDTDRLAVARFERVKDAGGGGAGPDGVGPHSLRARPRGPGSAARARARRARGRRAAHRPRRDPGAGGVAVRRAPADTRHRRPRGHARAGRRRAGCPLGGRRRAAARRVPRGHRGDEVGRLAHPGGRSGGVGRRRGAAPWPRRRLQRACRHGHRDRHSRRGLVGSAAAGRWRPPRWRRRWATGARWCRRRAGMRCSSGRRWR